MHFFAKSLLQEKSFRLLLLTILLTLVLGITLALAPLSLAVRVSLIVVTCAILTGLLIAYSRMVQREEGQRMADFELKLRESEERLRQAQKMEAIGQLAGGVAHDFNNLITVISCSAELLAEATEPADPKQEDLQQIREATDRAANLTRQLLAFSRRQIVQPKALNLNDVIASTEKMLHILGPHISVRTNLDPNLGQVLADLGQMEQIVMNLAVNARDAMPSAGSLTLSTANRTLEQEERHMVGTVPPGNYTVLSIKDTGQGMEDEVLEHLFEPFFTTKDTGKGTGLGLATVHGIVHQANGYITVDSAPGRGTTFILYFPRVEAGTSTNPQRLLSTSQEHPSQRPKKHSILIVDDEDAIREIATRVLQQAQYHVISAAHGEDALQILTQHKREGHPIDLVLTDVAMPVMNGPELASLIATEHPETRVLCISGYTREELVNQRLINSRMTLIQKPFELGVLLTAVRSALVPTQTVPAN